MSIQFDLIIIGGGAAGFFTAICAKQANPNLSVLLLEATNNVLTKVKVSGGGRCNVTHNCFEPKKLMLQYPRQHKQLRQNFAVFGPKETIAWFQQQGVQLKTESDGRMFPVSNTSSTIVECLHQLAKRYQIQINLHSPVKSIIKTDVGFTVQTDKEQLVADKVVLATGGAPSGYKLLQQLGHQPIESAPSLFTFKINDRQLTDLSGVSLPWVKGKLVFTNGESLQQEGPLLVTHWGLSGPCILRLSAWGARVLKKNNYQAKLEIDFFPSVHHEALRAQLLAYKDTPKQIKNWPIDLPQRFWEYLLAQQKLPLEQSAVNIKDKLLNQFAEKLKAWPFEVNGKGQFKEEFVTAGGLNLDELNMKTYESLLVPNLYVVGELLNIDGVTGGFNFQNAWTSGYLAAQAITSKT